MRKFDAIVVGGGISGLSFAWESAKAGQKVLLIDRANRPGGCISTNRFSSGFWLESGAHTCYNSYANLLRLVEETGLLGKLVRRAPTTLRFLDGDALVPGSNLGLLMRLMGWFEALVHLPNVFWTKKKEQTVKSYYSRIFGPKNYERVLGPMLSAVPSQPAHEFPADMLFKKRPTRRKDLPRSFTIENGLSSLVEALAQEKGIDLWLSRRVIGVERVGQSFIVATDAGERAMADRLAFATGPSSAARLLSSTMPALAEKISLIKEASFDTLAFAVRAEKIRIPLSTFLIPRADIFHSIVTRDAVPNSDWRGFAFHFVHGLTYEERVARATRLLDLHAADLEELSDRKSSLPSPVIGHQQLVREIDELNTNSNLFLLGNWFLGLSLEDCVQRSRTEFSRSKAAQKN